MSHSRQRILRELLLEAGFGGETAGGTHEDEIEVMATIVDMALDASPSESHLVDILSWGSRVPHDREELRPIAQKLLLLLD